MKKLITGLLVIALILSMAVVNVAALAEGEMVEENGFLCKRLRDGNLRLEKYTGDPAAKSINIPSAIGGSHIERIGEFAFDGCGVVNVTIPETVKMIERCAFNDCAAIQKITIPNEVFFIDGNPFTGCTSLVNISLDPKHPTLQVNSDGALYSRRNRMLICYPCSKKGERYSVMKGTVSIDEYAFSGCEQLNNIELPDTVTEIGANAFMGCTNLTSVTLPESLLTIGELAFAGCTSLSGVKIPDKISQIEMGTFFNCQSLNNVSFPANLTKIADRAFYGCSKLAEIHLPANVSFIGNNAFYDCRSLADAYIPVSVTEIGDDAFENCSVSLYMHVDEYAYAEIYAKLYEISFTYGNEDKFLDYGNEPAPAGDGN